jgi:hypothetical protein
MTEAEWLACTDPEPMLRFRKEKVSDRKLRLFACACCRLIWHLLVDGRSRQAVEVAERYADQLTGEEELLHAQEEATQVAGKLVRAEAHAAASAARTEITPITPVSVAWQTTWALVRSRVEDVSRQIAQREAVRGAAWAELADLLRDLLGNLFHPIALNPAWRTPTTVSLAQAAYEERSLPSGTLDPDRLAVLADALEEAGCSDADLLGHLRGPGPHFRGCWALDLVLGRE